MGDSRDVRSPAFSLLSSRLGDMLLKLYKEDSPASKEFLYMGYELKAFHASYEVLRPYLQPSTYLISPIGSQLVRNIYDGVETICEELTGEIRVFSKQLEKARREHRKRAGYFFLLQGGNSFARDRNKRILKFFEGNKYVLERCQLRYGNMLLNLVLAVFAFSQFIRDAQEEAAFPDTSSYLINDLHTALDELRSRERKRKGNLSVKASWWWDGLPAQPPNVEPMPPLATLTRIWVNPEARLAAHPSPNDQAYQHIINQWREQNELQRDDIRRLAEENQRLETVNRDMTSDGVQLSRRIDELGEDKDNLQQTIDRLHGEIRRLVGEIETERTARHQQEQYTNYYRDQHERVQSQFNNLLTQKEVEALTMAHTSLIRRADKPPPREEPHTLVHKNFLYDPRG
ncbi:hypothetical protein BDV95DRAFT_604640 [Massariosphaeria phaeospora]|uniref:Uncharacterized protein n=1 Tax=Massariosphaeria phaeospora TaxID=100035 RepID=A0A7C8MG18_9PLEO|nr:hypothetical protein BDV95DRAFT_604640 [Massariosphaeria phaeospora]